MRKTKTGLEVASSNILLRGAGVSIDNLGENVTNADESKHSSELYHRLLDEISTRKLNANVSLKLTHMGFDVSTTRYHLAGFVYRGDQDDVTQVMLGPIDVVAPYAITA